VKSRSLLLYFSIRLVDREASSNFIVARQGREIAAADSKHAPRTFQSLAPFAGVDRRPGLYPQTISVSHTHSSFLPRESETCDRRRFVEFCRGLESEEDLAAISLISLPLLCPVTLIYDTIEMPGKTRSTTSKATMQKQLKKVSSLPLL